MNKVRPLDKDEGLIPGSSWDWPLEGVVRAEVLLECPLAGSGDDRLGGKND